MENETAVMIKTSLILGIITVGGFAVGVMAVWHKPKDKTPIAWESPKYAKPIYIDNKLKGCVVTGFDKNGFVRWTQAQCQQIAPNRSKMPKVKSNEPKAKK